MRAAACALLGTAFAAAAAGVDLPARPVAKVGPCPPGYHTNGRSCDPGEGSAYALVKRGPCPPRYRSSGGYCLAMEGAGLAVANTGRCPLGFANVGRYCLDQRSR
jgi:hypothetical protein